MDPLLDFTGKVAVITGAAQGFGKLLAEELAMRGAKLVISTFYIALCFINSLRMKYGNSGIYKIPRRLQISAC